MIAKATPHLPIVSSLLALTLPWLLALLHWAGPIPADLGLDQGELRPCTGPAHCALTTWPVQDVAATMVASVKQATAAVEQMQQEDASPASVGFGCHFGEVMYGNMGTHDRLDFTVMGRSVNLASRLESLCGPLSRSAIFSSAVARLTDGLMSAGRHALKGFSEPVEIWVLPE